MQMLIISCVTVTLIVIFLIYWKCVHLPRQMFNYYQTTLEKLGYKVYVHPFRAFSFPYLQSLHTYAETHGDAHYAQKNIYPQYDAVLFNAINYVCISLINPALIKDFLSIQKSSNYPKMQLLLKGLKIVIGDSLVFSEGNAWKRKKKILSHVFNFDLIKANIRQFSLISDQNFCAAEQRYYKDHPQSDPKKNGNGDIKVQLLSFNANLFSSVIIQCFFGSNSFPTQFDNKVPGKFLIDFFDKAQQLSTDLSLITLGSWFYKLGLRSLHRDLLHKNKLLRDAADILIKKRTQQIIQNKSNIGNTDLIAAFMNLKGQDQISVDNTQLIDEFSAFLLAGTQTTSRLLQMMVYLTAQNPHVQAKLRRQISEFIKCQQDINYQNLKNLKYIDYIQNQTLRYYGPVNGILFREDLKQDLIADIPILKGTVLDIQPTCNHHNSKYFKNPQQFRPERWETECNNLQPFVFVGFSAGLRTCIGKYLALMESKIACIKLYSRYGKITGIPKEIKMQFKFLYQPQEFEIILGDIREGWPTSVKQTETEDDSNATTKQKDKNV